MRLRYLSHINSHFLRFSPQNFIPVLPQKGHKTLALCTRYSHLDIRIWRMTTQALLDTLIGIFPHRIYPSELTHTFTSVNLIYGICNRIEKPVAIPSSAKYLFVQEIKQNKFCNVKVCTLNEIYYQRLNIRRDKYTSLWILNLSPFI